MTLSDLLWFSGFAFCIMSIVMTLSWYWQKKTGIAGIVDVIWAFGTGIVAAAGAWLADAPMQRKILIIGMALIWSMRLGYYLARRLMREKEDIRYTKAKEMWQGHAQRNMFFFYQIQAFWTILFALPIISAAASESPFGTITDYLAIAIWLLAIGGETLADQQLKRYRQHHFAIGKPEKPICDVGLWRYSRHPNYFFEWLHWFSYAAIAIQAMTSANLGSFNEWGIFLVAALSPWVMLYFLLKVTGIPLTEKYMRESRGEAYEAYASKTSSFFPLPPKRNHVNKNSKHVAHA